MTQHKQFRNVMQLKYAQFRLVELYRLKVSPDKVAGGWSPYSHSYAVCGLIQELLKFAGKNECKPAPHISPKWFTTWDAKHHSIPSHCGWCNKENPQMEDNNPYWSTIGLQILSFNKTKQPYVLLSCLTCHSRITLVTLPYRMPFGWDYTCPWLLKSPERKEERILSHGKIQVLLGAWWTFP